MWQGCKRKELWGPGAGDDQKWAPASGIIHAVANKPDGFCGELWQIDCAAAAQRLLNGTHWVSFDYSTLSQLMGRIVIFLQPN